MTPTAALAAVLLSAASCVGEIAPSVGMEPSDDGPPVATRSGATATTGLGPKGAELALGDALYGKHCADCHGPLSASTKKGKSFSAVSLAVAEVPNMAALRGVLSAEDIGKIVLALDFERTAVCDTTVLSRSTRVSRLTRQEYFYALADVLGIKYFETFDIPFEPDGEGFDNDSHLLTVTSKSLAGYLSTAREAVRRAFVEQAPVARQLLQCETPAGDDLACLSQVLGRVGRIAFRRPLAGEELGALVRLFGQTRARADFATSVGAVLRGMLSAPTFLFKSYTRGAAQGAYDLDGPQLAARLSFFLWSGPPDETLLQLAVEGSLGRREVLRGQVSRMLGDARSRRFSSNFFQQWLGIRSYASEPPPDGITPALKDAFIQESQRFFEEILDRNLPTDAILAGNFTYLNALLAKHYQIGAVTSSQHQRVPLDGTPRVGFLGQGSFLTATASPTGRGKWILLNLLCLMPGPVPMQAELSEEDKGRNVPFKEKVKLHASKPDCRGCHAEMDPFGFALERFDRLARWRTHYPNGEPVDPSGSLDGVAFSDHRELVRLVAQRPDFKNCFTQKLVSYAVARGLSTEERCSANGIAQRAARTTLGLRDLIAEIVLDDLFTKNVGGK